MARVLVIADDLTGANACAAGFARDGLRAVTVGPGQPWEAVAEFHGRFDVVVVTTESRHAPPSEAADAIVQASRAGWPVDLMCCRIDTPGRGNWGVAAQAVIRAQRELAADRRVVGLCLPAFPSAGRVTVDGNQLLHGQRLETTELAHDVRSPVKTSSIAETLAINTDLTSALIPLSLVTGPMDELVGAIRSALKDDPDVIIGDALTLDHLDRLAEAAVAAAPDVAWVSIDPGLGSLALAKAMNIRGEGGARPVLVFSGSATELTQQQLGRLIGDRDVAVVRPVAQPDSPLPDVEDTVSRLVSAVQEASGGQVVLFATVLAPEDIHNLTTEQADEFPHVLGQIAQQVLSEVSIDGLYTTGGDITAAVLEQIGGQGIEVEDEIVPLAVAGEVVGGSLGGVPIVTKGGLIGGPETAIACVDHLIQAGAQRSRWVRSVIATREPAS